MANNGVGRVGMRSYVAAPTQVTASTLLTSLYSVWNADTTSSTLDTSIFGAWNGEAYNNATVKNAWNANGNAIDSKSAANGTIVTPNSTNGYTTSSMTYGTGKLGTASFTFDGTNFVTLPNNTFKFINDFTVSCWFYVPTNYVNNAYLLSAFDNQASYPTYFGWMMGYDSTNKNISFYICRNDMGQYYTLGLSTATNSIVPGQWNHVTITRKLSTRSRIYINGVLSTSNTSTINPVYNNGYSSIGSAYYAFSYPFWKAANAGLKIDAVQTWESELDQTAVTELYNSGNGQQYPFTVSNALIPSFNDAVGTNNGTRPDTTLNGGVLGPVFTTGKVGNAFQFDGINDFIQLPNNSMNFTGDFSISAWLYFPTATQLIGSDYGHILSNWTAVTWTSNLAGWRFDTAGNTIYFTTYNGTSTTVSLGAPGMGLDRSGWRHIAFTRTGTEYKLWLDGGQYTATSTTMLVPKYQGTIIPKIGRLGDSTMGGWDSYSSSKILIDAVTVWQKSLSSDEITQLYNAGNGTQYPFSSQTLSSSANQLGVDNGTLMNGCTFTDGKIGKAFTFDGVNDYIDLPNNSMNFTGDFSVSGWINQSSIKPYHMIIGNQGTSTGNWHGWLVWVFNNKLTFDLYNGNSAVASGRWQTTTTLDANTWIHFTITKKPNQAVKIYLNGVINGGLLSGSNSANVTYTTTNYATIGLNKYSNTIVSSDAGYWNGKIDALNVWQREITQAEVTELYNSGAGKQLTVTTPIVTNGLVLNLDASRSSSYPNTGTTWFDISGNVNNGTLTNGPIFATANGGQITFDGINDYVVTSDTPFRFSNKFTISIWFYWDGLDKTNKAILGKRSGPGGNYAQYAMGINNGDVQYGGTGKVLFFYARVDGSVGGNDPLDVIMTYTLPSTSGIYNVSVTMDSNIQKLYINGVLVTSSAKNLVGKTYNISGREFLIGANRDDAGTGALAHFNGKIYSVYVYGRTLTDSETTQNFNATKSRFGL